MMVISSGRSRRARLLAVVATATLMAVLASIMAAPAKAAVSVSANQSVVTVNEGQTATNSGTFGGSGGNVVIEAFGRNGEPIGTVTKSGTDNGMWNWSFKTDDGHAESQTVTITATRFFLVDGNIEEESASASFALNVNNVPPVAVFNAPASVNEGGSFTIFMSGAFDPSNADTQNGFTYRFDCGSGFGNLGSASGTACPTNDSGNRTVRAEIRDKDGGARMFTAAVVVNNVAPTANFNAPPSADEGVAFEISLANPHDPSSVDTASGFTYAFDCGEGFGAFGVSNTATCQAGNAASRTVRATIRDKDGGETVYTRTVAVNDVAPPNITITSGPSGLVRSASATFEWSGSDNRTPNSGLLYSYKLDGGEWSEYSADTGVTLSGLGQGAHTIHVRAKDAAGNVDESPATRAFTVDTVAPRGSIRINNGAATTRSLSVRLTLTASDSVSGVSQMCVSNTTRCSAWQPFARSKAWKLSGNKAGTKTVYVRFKDRAGNVSVLYKDAIRYAPRR